MSAFAPTGHRTALALLAAAALFAAAPTGPGAVEIAIPPDSVTTFPVDVHMGGYGNIGGVTTDALGFVYVASFREAVWRVDLDGSSKMLSDALYGSSGNAVDSRGDLYQSDFNAGTVTRIRRTGEVETFVSEGLNGPVGLAFDGEDNLYVCNCGDGSISKVTPGGAVSEFALSPLLACPNGITRDDRGDLYVVCFNSDDLLRATPDGTVHPFTKVPGAGGNGHIVFARGGFFVTQFRGHALWVNDLVGPYNGGAPTEIVLRRVRMVTLGDVLAGALEGVDAAGAPAAVALFERNAERYAGDAGAAYHLGEAYRYTGRPDEAAEQYRRVLEIDPDHQQAAARLELSVR